MFYDLEDPNQFIRDAQRALADEGVFFEVSQPHYYPEASAGARFRFKNIARRVYYGLAVVVSGIVRTPVGASLLVVARKDRSADGDHVRRNEDTP